MAGGSALILGGRPTFRFGGSGASEAFERIDCDRLWLMSDVLVACGRAFLIRRGCFFGLSGSGESSSERGLTSLSSLDGLRGLKPRGVDRLFHGVELALRTIAP